MRQKAKICRTFSLFLFFADWSIAWNLPPPPRPTSRPGQDAASDNERRRIILSTCLLPGLAFPLHSDAAPTSTGEAIRRSAASIPGYGQTDVFFPPQLLGKWRATRNIVASNEPSMESKLPLTLEYEMRFIPSVDDGAVVCDRGYNQASLDQALANAVDGRNSVRSFEWAESNPNDLRLVLSNGANVEIKVTKRATERTEGTVSSSEFQRITREDTSGIPSVSAQRVLQKWKVVNEQQVEGIEIAYDMGGDLADPMKMTIGGGTSSSPEIMSKSRISLTKLD